MLTVKELISYAYIGAQQVYFNNLRYYRESPKDRKTRGLLKRAEENLETIEKMKVRNEIPKDRPVTYEEVKKIVEMTIKEMKK